MNFRIKIKQWAKLRLLDCKSEKQAERLINNVQRGKNLEEVDQLAYQAELSIRNVASEEKKEQLRQKLATVLDAKLKTFSDLVKMCTNLDDMYYYRSIIHHIKFCFSSSTLKRIFHNQIEEAKKINADMIIDTIEKSTDDTEILDLYDIVDLYLHDNMPSVDIEDVLLLGVDFFEVKLDPDRKEINDKLNRCINKKVDLFLAVIENYEGFYFDSSMDSLLYRMECVLEDNEKGKFNVTLLKIINHLLSQIKENPDDSLIIRIDQLKCCLPVEMQEDIASLTLQVLQDSETQFKEDNDNFSLEQQKVLGKRI